MPFALKEIFNLLFHRFALGPDFRRLRQDIDSRHSLLGFHKWEDEVKIGVALADPGALSVSIAWRMKSRREMG